MVNNDGKKLSFKMWDYNASALLINKVQCKWPIWEEKRHKEKLSKDHLMRTRYTVDHGYSNKQIYYIL